MSGELNLTSDYNPAMAHTQQSAGGATMASSFRGRSTAKSAEELKKARESRAAEALKMKDEQLKILSDQNATLLQNLDKVHIHSFYCSCGCRCAVVKLYS